MEFLTSIWPYVSEHPYLFLFIGMLIGGETFLLPAVYLASRGTINFSFVFLLSALATVISDTAWYAIGRSFPLEKILGWSRFAKHGEKYRLIFAGFRKHTDKFLFLSKFVYGTRTIIQVLSGSVRMPFLRYSAINILGITLYLASISFLAITAEKSLDSLGGISYNKYVSITVFILIIFIFHLCLKKWLGKKFLAQSSLPGTKSGQ